MNISEAIAVYDLGVKRQRAPSTLLGFKLQECKHERTERLKQIKREKIYIFHISCERVDDGTAVSRG